jgi:hypothetical protein
MTAGGVGEPQCVAAARLRQPNVARRGEDSGKDTGGGRDDKTTCGRRKQSCRHSRAAGGRRHARAAGKTEELGDSRRKTEGPVAKSRGLTVKHGQLSHHCSNEDGPKSKSV